MAQRKEAVPPAAPDSNEHIPQFYSTDTGVGLPTIDVAPAFVFAHHRKRWCIMDGRVVPELAPIPLVSGANRVFIGPDGRIQFAEAKARLEERHWRVIMPDRAPNGRTYLQTVETMDAAGARHKTTITVWETAHAGESRTSWNFKAYADWLEDLVKRGLIDPITQHRASEMLEQARTTLAKSEQRLANGRNVPPHRLESLRAEVEILTKLVEGGRGKPVVRGEPVAGTEAELELR